MDAAKAEFRYDVAIIGGALSGAATAIQLLRERPQLRVLIIEKAARFGRKVGEATVEISTYFLTHSLGLTEYLNEAHLNKQGLRFYFANGQTRNLEQCGEIGGKYLVRIPSYLVDRSTLDEEVLRRACAMGAELWRPASVQKVELSSGGTQILEVRSGESVERVVARWIVDASGVAAMLSRQNGWWRSNTAHPTAAVWSRWTGVKDWDSPEIARKYPKFAMACHGVRRNATNHLTGDGWWAWMIPLKGGDVSVGVVFDQRLMTWPEGGSLGHRLKDFLMKNPIAAELMADAQWMEGDMHWRKNLAYYSTAYAGDGFALVGDASAFMDPFYSPGMDWISFTTTGASELILAQQRGEEMAPRIARHNRDFVKSHQRWFQAVYQDKYDYMGEYDLMSMAFVMDLGFYYMGVVSQPFKRGRAGLTEPVFSTPPSTPFYLFMRTYNRRFAAISRARRARNCLARSNMGRRCLIPGFTFSLSSTLPIVRAIGGWAMLELKEGWRSWFNSRRPATDLPPAPVRAPASS